MTVADIRWGQEEGPSTCEYPGCGKKLRGHNGKDNRTGYCRAHWGRNSREESANMEAMKAQPAPAKHQDQFKAYTLKRTPGGGWRMVTCLVSDLDVIDESFTDTRDAMMTRIEDQLRRLE